MVFCSNQFSGDCKTDQEVGDGEIREYWDNLESALISITLAHWLYTRKKEPEV